MTNKDTDTASKGVSLKLTATVGALMLLLGGAALAGGGKMRGHMFDRLDANNDDRITLNEVAPFAEKRFSRFDTDGDGTVSAEEVDAHLRKHMERRRARILERFDADGNGTITKAEFSAKAEQMFERADADKDGAVTRTEAKEMRRHFRAHWRKHMDEMDGTAPDKTQEN